MAAVAQLSVFVTRLYLPPPLPLPHGGQQQVEQVGRQLPPVQSVEGGKQSEDIPVGGEHHVLAGPAKAEGEFGDISLHSVKSSP